ncbi:hypothetical protein [Micromonospora tulbaghiae]|uniref:hypothetical protein n=1 Tax=Micromonospora tulbaghiae TaxID=479978 RepID=UPI00371E5679
MSQIFDIDSTVRELAVAVESLSARAKAALFGACGEALQPILAEVSRRTLGRWVFEDAQVALDRIRGFVDGSQAPGDYAALRQRLLESGPNGHELDSPWSTYAQDVLTCIDAAVVAASVRYESDFKSVWVQSVINPMVVSLDVRGYDAEFEPVPVGSTELQAELDRAVSFVFSVVADLSDGESVSRDVYEGLVQRAVVLRPVILG